MSYLEIANLILESKYQSGLIDHPGLASYLITIADGVNSIGGSFISRQVIAMAIETWFLLKKSESIK